MPESRSVVAGGKQGGTERRADEGDTLGGVHLFTFVAVVTVSQVCTSIRIYQAICLEWRVYYLSMYTLLHVNDTSIKLLKFSKFFY